MKKRPIRSSPMSLRSAGTLLNTSTANPCQKGWSSERVPLPAGSSRRYAGNSTFLPFLNGRAMPSKWEDAEKWIFNPISGEGQGGSPFLYLPHYARPKSKSGPLRTPSVSGGSSYLSSSPQMPMQTRVSEEIKTRKSFPASSPFLTGVLVPDHGCYRSVGSERGLHGVENGEGGGRRRSCSSHADKGVLRTVGVHVWSDLSAGSSSSSEAFQDDDLETAKGEAARFSPEIQRKDAGTQMSPEGNGSFSPKERARFSLSSSSLSTSVDQIQSHFSNLEVRDVQIDDLVVRSGWSMAHVESADWKSNNLMGPTPSAWETSESAKYTSKLKRHEAKIIAWENLQKAQADAAINKLEMKLEKKRSASVDKIMKDLRSAQEKAQDMRNALAARQAGQMKRAKMKAPTCLWKKTRMTCFSGCFACHVC